MMAATAEYQHFLSVGPRWALGQQETQAQLNQWLASTIPVHGHQLFATTLAEQSKLPGTREAKNAENLAVILIGAARSLGCVEESSDAWLNITPHCFYRNLPHTTKGVDVILAHAPDYVWGALNIQEVFFPSSHLVLFNHMFPENTNKMQKKNIREWAAKAALVVSFDKETFDKYNNLYGNLAEKGGSIDHRHIEIIDLTMELLQTTALNISVGAVHRNVSLKESLSVEKMKADPNISLDGKVLPDAAVIMADRKACSTVPADMINGKTSKVPGATKTSPKAKKVDAFTPATTLATNSSKPVISRLASLNSHDWHDKMTSTLRKFHDDHARFPDKAVKAAMPFFEGTMKQVEGKLRENNLCVRFEYTGSAYEKVMIDGNDIEFDLMVIMSKGGDLDVELFDDGTRGYYLLTPKEEVAKEYSKMIHTPDNPVVSPEKVVNIFFSALQKALNEIGVMPKAKLRKHGPAVQMDIYHDASKTQKWFSVDIVPAFQIRTQTEYQLFVAKPYRDAKTSNQSWRRSFSAEEKQKFLDVDKGDGCRRMCVRIMKAIRKPTQSMKRKPDSSFAHITSFMIKNALFHENDDRSLSWAMDKLAPRTIGLISRLAMYLEEGHFPHYYLPELNIVAGMEDGPRLNLANRLQHLISSDVAFRKVINAE